MQLPKLNQIQIKTLANLAIEVGKWILVSIVLTSIFSQNQLSKTKIENSTMVLAGLLAAILVVYGIRLLKGVKDK